MNINIKVDTGQYKDVYEANDSQGDINWWDETDRKAIICTQCFLAIDLMSQLKKVNNKVAINGNKGSVTIYIGDQDFDDTLQGEQGRLISYMKNDIRIIKLYGNSREGTLNAVYEYLNKLGFRYYNTDKALEISPSEIILSDFNYITTPNFVTRGCYNAFTDDSNLEFINWMTRNRMNMISVNKYFHPYELKKRGIKLLSGGHEIFYDYLNPNKIYPYDKKDKIYFEVHPEWFALIDGKRSNRDENNKATEGYYTGDNICTSNTQGIKELSNNLITSLINGKLKYCDLLNLWAYDNGKWCQCESCNSIGNYSTRILMLAYYIINDIKKAYKDRRLGRVVKLIIPIYHETLVPPIIDLPDDFDYENIIITYFPIERCYVHYINDENCTESNLHLKKSFEEWAIKKERKYKGEVFIGEYFNVSSFASLPFLFTDMIAHDLPYYYRNNARHFYYMHISTDEWGMLTLNNYLIAKLLWNINTNKSEILEEYYNDIYPNFRNRMKEFHGILEKASANAKYFKHYQFEEKGKEKPSLMWKMFDKELFPLKHCKFDYRVDDKNAGPSLVESMKLFYDAKKILYEIKGEYETKETKALEIEKMRFDYGYMVLSFLYELVKLRFAHMENDFLAVQKQIIKTEELRKQLKVIKRPIKEDRYECNERLDNAFKATWVSKRYMEYIKEIIY